MVSLGIKGKVNRPIKFTNLDDIQLTCHCCDLRDEIQAAKRK